MGNISILDCTLRDGGYVNQWKFGASEKRNITESIIRAGVEIVECGFLKDAVELDENLTLYNDISDITNTLPANIGDAIAVCMINYGEYNVDNLPVYSGQGVSGIRIAFHKNDAEGAIKMAYEIKGKGYKVFMQPMVSLNYTDAEFIDLIEACNRLMPYAFYIVDSFGMMQRKDVVRLFYIVDNNLDKGIKIGFHAHNNLQMALLNAQALIDIRSDKDLLIDSSILGMGRGAGNLNTELLTHFLNENYDKSYDIRQLLYIVDSVINDIYIEKYWGYSIPNYLSAIHSCHPNYVTYLDEKKTMTVDDMNSLFSTFSKEKRKDYDKDYAEKMYVEYMLSKDDLSKHGRELREALKGKEVLVLAAGKSIVKQQKTVEQYLNNSNITTISVNYEYSGDVDYIFVGNRRRYSDLENIHPNRLILVSNIDADVDCNWADYSQLLNENDVVRDNSGLMLIKLLIDLGVKKIYLAGMDGYTYDSNSNFAINNMKTHMSKNHVDQLNDGMRRVLDEYRKCIDIEFITETVL